MFLAVDFLRLLGAGIIDMDVLSISLRAQELLKALDTTANDRVDRAASKTDSDPSTAQAVAGNYRKGRLNFGGLTFVIENAKGSTRKGGDPDDGTYWESVMHHHYGYLAGTEGKDGDEVDVFIGPDINSDTVYVINQVTQSGSFDETKSMVGFASASEARAGYLKNYPAGWTGIGSMASLPFDSWKEWALSGNHKKPVESMEKEKSFTPNDSMKSNARKGLEWRKKYGKGGTAVGVARARDIVNGKGLSLSTVKRMHSFFSRHSGNEKGPVGDNGRTAWALWGGTAGAAWARNILRQEGLLKKEDDTMEFRTEVEILSKESVDDGPLYVYGAVLIPDKFDRQGDIVDKDVIRKAAREYMINAQHAGLKHKWLLAKEGIQLTQNFIAPADMKIGQKDIPEGSWVVEFRVTDSTLKKAISEGQYKSFSVGGRTIREPVEE